MRLNHKEKTANFKIVWFGTGLSGKTTTLEEIYRKLSPTQRISEVIKEADTHGDRTIFFDMLPVDGGKIGQYSVLLRLYTVPGQSHYINTRKKVLAGADGIVFVADSQPELRDSNLAAMKEMRQHLTEQKIKPNDIPLVLQFNKRDLPNLMSIEQMYRDLTRGTGERYIETAAISGKGVTETLDLISGLTVISKTKPQNA